MPPLLLCWPTTSEAHVGGMAVEIEPSHQYSTTFCCCDRWQQRGSLTVMPDMEVCVVKFLREENIASIDIHQYLLNVYGYQTVDVSTVWQ